MAVCSLIFGGIFERLPHLRVLYAHAGGSFPATVGRVQHGFDCRPDLCAVDNQRAPTEYMGQFWIDHLTHSKQQLKYVLELVGENRVCFGTDYPFPLGECYPLKKPGENIDGLSLDVSAAEETYCKRRLLGENALEWLYGVEQAPKHLERFASSMHRATKKSWEKIASQFDESFAGDYSFPLGGTLVLKADGTTSVASAVIPVEAMPSPREGELPKSPRTVTATGTWRVATYDRIGRPNTDIELKLSTQDPAKMHDGTQGRGGGALLLRQRSEWRKTGETFKVVLDTSSAKGECKVNTAKFVRAFSFEHLKRRSGKNDLLEGQKS